MFLLDDRWITSATDLVGALRCEYGLLARRAEKAGLVPVLETEEDALLARAAILGDVHEHRVLDRLITDLGKGTIGQAGGVVVIDQPSTRSRQALEDAHEQTRQAFEGGAEIVFQAAFFDGTFHGLADFVVRTIDEHGAVSYEPADTKLARHAKVEALLQLASYAEQLIGMGQPVPQDVHLWLGDDFTSTHRLADLRPILLDRQDRMAELLSLDVAIPEWGDPHLRACGRCGHCLAAIEQRRDLWLVAGMRADQRQQLRDQGIATIEALAAADEAPAGVRAETFAKLHAQARLQVIQDGTRTAENPDGVTTHEVIDPAPIALVPEPNPGDVFFDFEGDPLYTEHGWDDTGLEYLWGHTTVDNGEPEFHPLWAHDRAEERAALIEFLDWVTERRKTPGFEGLHVYHYAAYEITALKKLVQRYGTHSEVLDDLLRAGVFVDLFSVVRRSIRISERSYSIKRLEPLYMGDQYRDGEVLGGAESVVWYAEFQEYRATGDTVAAEHRLAELADYNRYDCLSTLRLRDWLLARPGAGRPTLHETAPGDAAGVEEVVIPWYQEAADLAAELLGPFADLAPDERTGAQQNTAMVAAALEFHHREEVPYWWSHFARLAAPIDDWLHDGEMVVIDPATASVVDDWHTPDGKRTLRRTFTTDVELARSFKLRPGSSLFALYDAPVPAEAARSETADRGFLSGVTLDDLGAAGDRTRVTITQQLPGSVNGQPGASHDAYPAAVSVTDGPSGKPQARAILALARRAFEPGGELVAHPALDLIARRPPRLVGGQQLPEVVGGDYASAMTDAIRALDRSYLAVQGPPGTGKTWTGARVVKRLVESGWKVGVVAQGHRTVEQMLEECIDAGLDPQQVVKKLGRGGEHRGQKLKDAGLLAAVTNPDQGVLMGGTKWDFVNEKRVPAEALDLLVIDEAGQFSLADTLAVSQATSRLLLLGDPQQLPQVSQARHPEPIDRAALVWVADGARTLPRELGYFLDTTYRMRPEVCAVSSALSYDGQLTSAQVTAKRALDGIAPGIVTRLVEHDNNIVSSPEEANEVLGLVEDLLGRTWTDGDDSRPLGEGDVLVVAPYNAQVNRLREALDDAGHPDVAVGSVDKFQGAQAPVVIVSMAASNARGGRGSGFVLSRNRLNVAISRAQHTAYLVHAPGLTNVVPSSPKALTALGAFLGVSQAGSSGLT